MAIQDRQEGFTLIEMAAAMVVLLVALLGTMQVFTYAILYNNGNNSRAETLAVLQQEVEGMRAAKWTTSGMDAALSGGVKSPRVVQNPRGSQFRISTTVDDDPSTDGTQVDTTSNIKEISITAILDAPSPGWQFAVPVTIVMRRTKGN